MSHPHRTAPRLACVSTPLVCLVLLVAWPAMAQDEDDALSSEEAAERTLTTAAADVPRSYTFWESEELGGFIKPVLQISASVVGYMPDSDVNDDLSGRTSTLLVSRFGLEGQLFEYVTFRSVFERNLGFSFGRNGPVGTSVWEGTAALQARENYIRLSRWGLSLAGGIVPDPASVDYVPTTVLDLFGMDPYVRDPMLVSGSNQGQGFLLRYNWRWLTLGFSYTGGNPLTTSLASGFGGDVSSLGTLFRAPLRALSNGVPGSDIHVNIISPSLTFESEYVDINVAYQHYFVDVDITQDEDVQIGGYNARTSFQVKLFDSMLRIMGGASLRRNEQLAVPDITTTRPDDFEGLLFNGGLEFIWRDLAVGGNYYWIESTLSEGNEFTNQYINFGASYWLAPPNVAVGVRFARSMTDSTQTEPILKATNSLIASLRLLI